ncbi:hypothetical protein OJAV_G00109210 [Oryzias javanicus]|uniref:Borealin N-terminal domain-containing protein n=1 Tax=Oryzias javanicus TaxID=123683 RepID=A0A3S2PPT8_ORYJA|nr:hypothetical protein OJAV_G00109210 [Oryzias javanicus]
MKTGQRETQTSVTFFSADMAPRKRTTRQQKNNQNMEKLDVFLEDFDSEVNTRVVQMKEKINHLLKDIDNSYNMALIKLPMAVRQMVWLEFCKVEKPKLQRWTALG